MREPKDFEESGPGLRSFSLNSDYAHWLTLEDQEESMLPRVARSESLNGRVQRLPPGVEGEDGSDLGFGGLTAPRRSQDGDDKHIAEQSEIH